MLGLIIIFSLIGGVFSLAGGLLLLTKKRQWSHQTMLTAISFAAGVLLAVAFADLLPEAIESGMLLNIDASTILLWTLIAIAGFFLFERSFVWFHHHHEPHQGQPSPVISMVMIGDTMHNFIDGIVITASFMVSVPLGITTAIAVAAHELPQEIADFSLFLSKGIDKTKVIFLNMLSSLATVVAAVLAYAFWDTISSALPFLLAFTAGMFAYIACSDLIPELHHGHAKKETAVQVVMFLLGIVLTIWMGQVFRV